MSLSGIGEIASLVETGINKIWPDKTEEQKAAAAQFLAQLNAEVDLLKGQIDVDKTEAASASTFVAGWRPFVGWVCGSAFAYAFVLQPFMTFGLVAAGVSFDPKTLPVLDISSMMPVLLGMLGLAGMRSYDKRNGVGGGH